MNNHAHHDHHTGGGFSSGLIFGAVLGAGAVFLLGTKGGRKILKTLTENGIDGLGLQDFLDETFLENEEEEYIRPQSPVQPAKRFFKGIKR